MFFSHSPGVAVRLLMPPAGLRFPHEAIVVDRRCQCSAAAAAAAAAAAMVAHVDSIGATAPQLVRFSYCERTVLINISSTAVREGKRYSNSARKRFK